MTPEEHRRLDALVAEQVMGICAHLWTYAPDEYDEEGYVVDPGDYPTKVCSKCKQQVAGLAFRVGGGPHCPAYSTEITAAWSVVERMRKIGWHVVIRCDPDPAWAYQVKIERAIAEERLALEGADTAPHAICLAALAAIGDTDV